MSSPSTLWQGVAQQLHAAATAAVATAAAPAAAAASSSSSPSASKHLSVTSEAENEDMRLHPEDYKMPDFAAKAVAFLSNLSSPEGQALKKKIYAVLLLSGGTFWAYDKFVSEPERRRKREADKKAAAAAGVDAEAKKDSKQRVAVDGVFFKRLGKILSIVIPAPSSKEMIYIVILTALLFARTWFSIYIAELVGVNAQNLVSRKWGRLWDGIKTFALITIPASAVNSGLKYCTEIISLMFRKRLSEYVHDQYLAGVNFYKACNLGGDRIDNADQRVTADIKDFSDEIAQLYSSLLKPLLDVSLFTYKLGQILGWQGPLFMHGYFFLSGIIKKRIMPNLGRLVARESELEGFYRTAHNRLITNSEEIAFYDGSNKEKLIINRSLYAIYQHISYSRYVKALIGVFDGLLVKYYASIAGYLTLLSPFVFNVEGHRDKATSDLTRDYIRNSQYLGNLSTAVGQLVMVGNKLTSIAGYTSRVSELLEMVQQLNTVGNKPFTIKADDTVVKPPEEEVDSCTQAEKFMTRADSQTALKNTENFVQEWKRRSNEYSQKRALQRMAMGESKQTRQVTGGGRIELGDDSIIFDHADIVSPEGKLLVQDLNFSVTPGVNVMVTGPNGVGKSSLFRIIGELWPLHSGVLHKPHKEDILFVPQKPYLVLGTLRDQIIYPHEHKDMIARGVTDKDLANLLAIVDPAQNILKEWSWDTTKDWFHAFSGGQKQRVAMARLFYHRPKFAILDECTSAVSDEVEGTIYATCRSLGITIFTVSHRPNLAKYHDKVLRFEGQGKWTVLNIDNTNAAAAANAIAPTAQLAAAPAATAAATAADADEVNESVDASNDDETNTSSSSNTSSKAGKKKNRK